MMAEHPLWKRSYRVHEWVVEILLARNDSIPNGANQRRPNSTLGVPSYTDVRGGETTTRTETNVSPRQAKQDGLTIKHTRQHEHAKEIRNEM